MRLAGRLARGQSTPPGVSLRGDQRLVGVVEAKKVTVGPRAAKLPQAILSKAFSGELVPTEAELASTEGRTYETAEAVLARTLRQSEAQSDDEGAESRKRRRRVGM
jgi:hypothetical protein